MAELLVYLDVIPSLRKKNSWSKGNPMYFLILFMLKITESKTSMNGDKWEQREQVVKADRMLSFSGETCVQVLEDYFRQVQGWY